MKTRNDQIAVLSLPSSGSTWFAKQLIESTGLIAPPDDNYEFFQPMRNLCHYSQLSRCFGLETPSLYRNIARRDNHQFDEVYRYTWANMDYTFCKEVWSFAKLADFEKHFRCVVLTRSAEETFPPNRLRVFGWYDAIWRSYIEVRGFEPTAMHGQPSPLDIAREAHRWATGDMLESAAAFQVPIIKYHTLTSGTYHEVLREVEQGWLKEIDTEKLANLIIETREQISRPKVQS